MSWHYIPIKAVCGAALFSALASCDSTTPPAGAQSPPAHPAMTAPAGKAGSSHSHSPMAGLPAGHPPVAPAPRPGAAAGAGAGAAAPAGAALESSCVERLGDLGLVCKLPDGWQEEPPSNSMRLGQARLPRVEGDSEDGEVSISPAMGSVEANVSRWVDQFVEKPKAVTSESTAGGIRVTRVELEGTFTGGGPMMKSAGGPKPGTKLLGVIASVPGAQQMIFFKAWGPKATMERWKPSFDELVASFSGSR